MLTKRTHYVERTCDINPSMDKDINSTPTPTPRLVHDYKYGPYVTRERQPIRSSI